LLFTSTDSLEWDIRELDQFFNVYRGSLATLRGSGVYTQNPILAVPERWCQIDPASLPFSDGYVPQTNKGVFYMVTTVTAGFEGSLGFDSSNNLRPNDFPCP
jgi:hypothetical protein